LPLLFELRLEESEQKTHEQETVQAADQAHRHRYPREIFEGHRDEHEHQVRDSFDKDDRTQEAKLTHPSILPQVGRNTMQSRVSSNKPRIQRICPPVTRSDRVVCTRSSWQAVEAKKPPRIQASVRGVPWKRVRK